MDDTQIMTNEQKKEEATKESVKEVEADEPVDT